MGDLKQAVEALARRARPGRRLLLGLTGPPGVGKSTAADRVAAGWLAHGRTAQVVGLDGFHLSNEELSARGLLSTKGAPETFDAEGFVVLLEQLRGEASRPVAVPGFDRDRETTIPGVVTVVPETELVIIEGNYLLLGGAWRPVRGLLDEVWYLDLPAAVRVPRLVARHITHGRSPQQAYEWVMRSDEANARLVSSTKPLADVVVRE